MTRDNTPKQAPQPATPQDLQYRPMAYLAAAFDKADRDLRRAQAAMQRAADTRARMAGAIDLKLRHAAENNY